MKIVQIIPNFGLGGAETMCNHLSVTLKSLGHDITVISLYNEQTKNTDQIEKAGINIVYLNKKSGFDISVIFKLRKILKVVEPDVIHTHLYILKYAVIAALGLKIKTKIHTVHNIAQKESGRIDRCINKVFYKLGVVTPVALSPEIQDTISNVYKLKSSKIPVVFNGVPLTNCIVKDDYSSCKNIIHIGRFRDVKNHFSLLEAVRKLKEKYANINLQLIGDGELFEGVKKYISDNGMGEYVKLSGLLNNVYAELNNSDIFVLPSKYEGVPMTIIEAMGTGLPIVASNVGGIPDMIVDGENGLLCEPTAESIAEKLEMFIKSQELREKCGKNALLSAERFSAKNMAQEYIKVYNSGEKQ